MRNAQLKELREDLKPENRFYMGRKSLVRVALGRNKTEAIKDNIHLVSQMLDKMKNECGLLFSNEDPETLAEKIQSFQVPDFARAGFLPTKRISLDAGPLPQFQGTQEPMLRKMGLKTTLKKGVVHLEESYLAAEPGVPLTPDQAHLLKLLGLHLAIFKVELVCHYEDGSFESLIDDEDDDDDDDEIPSDD